MTRPAPLQAWHAIAASRDPDGLDQLIADDCVFRSPAVHTPQEGKALTTAYLSAALVVLGPTLAYQHEWTDGDDRAGSAVLEFTAELEDKSLHGIDMIRWTEGRVSEFTVMVRPLTGLQALMTPMATELMRDRS